MKVYLDNASTTFVSDAVKREIKDFLDSSYGNPSSLHDLGLVSERVIKKTRKTIAKYLKIDMNEIIFTSGGTESNNLAIIGTALNKKNSGMHLVTTAYEHKSVLNSFKYLESLGYKVTYLKPNRDGIITTDILEQALTKETTLVSIMHINNEIGSINPINDIAKVIKTFDRRIKFHVDGVQSFGKYSLSMKNIDLFSFSGHKIHGIKGIGGLYKSKETQLENIHFGGQQEKGLRPGTENLLGIKALKTAIDEADNNIDHSLKHVSELKEYMMTEMSRNISELSFNSPSKISSPYILSVSFKYMMAEVLLHELESKGIYVSTGSACNSKSSDYSHVLESINLDEELLEGTIRISLSRYSTRTEIDYFLKQLYQSIDSLRKILKRR